MADGRPCYLDGAFLPLAEARVSPLDRGFLLGDGVYEVIPAYGGRPFRLDAHLERLGRSLAAVRIPPPLDPVAWREVLERLTAEAGGGDVKLYLQVTRGAPASRDHAFPEDAVPGVFAMAEPLTPPAPRGFRAVVLPDIRWRRCDIKTIALLPNVLLRQQALDAGADEAILVREEAVTEGAASNVLLVRDGVVVTPVQSTDLLPGVTRDLVLELAAAEGLAWESRRVGIAELAAAEEIWLTSSTKEVVPVVELDGQPVGAGRPGPVYRQVRTAFEALKQRLRDGEESA